MRMSEELLEHPQRRTLYETIIGSPGITFSELRRVLDLSDGTLQYHLVQLQKREMIRKEIRRGKRTYFSFETRSGDWDTEGETHKMSPIQRRFLTLIRDHPRSTQKELTILSRTNRFLLSYHLRQMIGMGLISSENDGRFIRYSVVDWDEMRRILLLKLVDELLDGRMDEETYIRLKKKIDR